MRAWLRAWCVRGACVARHLRAVLSIMPSPTYSSHKCSLASHKQLFLFYYILLTESHEQKEKQHCNILTSWQAARWLFPGISGMGFAVLLTTALALVEPVHVHYESRSSSPQTWATLLWIKRYALRMLCWPCLLLRPTYTHAEQPFWCCCSCTPHLLSNTEKGWNS